MRKLRTTIEINTGGLEDYSQPVEVHYSVYAGYAGSSTEPPEAASATIHSIYAVDADGGKYHADWLVSLLESDEELLNLCLLDDAERHAAAMEQRAEVLRDDRLTGDA